MISPRLGFNQGSEKAAIAALAIAMLLASLGSSVSNAALPSIASDLGASFQAAQWVVLSYLLVVTAFVVGIGRLADLVGRRRMLSVGVAVFTVASVLCAVAPTMPLLVLARAVQGLGGATMMGLALAFVGQVSTSGKQGVAMGVLGTASAIGTAMGPSLGGLLTASLGWRFIYLIAVPVGVAGSVMVCRYLPGDPTRSARVGSFDWLGTLLFGGLLGSYALAMTINKGGFHATNLLLLLLTTALLGAFAFQQSRTQAPLLPKGLARDRKLVGGLVSNLLVAAVLMTTLVVGPFYLAGALRLGPATVGLVLTVGPLVVVFCGVPAGKLAQRFGAPLLAAVGLAAIALGCMLLAIAPLEFGIAGYLVPIMLVTMGYAGFQTTNNILALADTESSRRNVVSGMLNLSRNLGLITGASLMGTAFKVFSRADDVRLATPHQISDGFHATLALAGALSLLALLIQAATGPRRTL